MEGILEESVLPAVVVTHGNLMALILRHFDDRFGFEEWQNLTNPDVFQATMTAGTARITYLRHAP